VSASPVDFGRAARDYELGRPDWPPEALDHVPLRRDAAVLDLGAGTGKLTRLLAARYRGVVAVEPDDGMRALIGDVEAVAGAAESIPLPDRSFDAVFVGEAFHWFDGERALAEIARVLRRRGVLALLWNVWEEIEPPLSEEARAFVRKETERAGPAGGSLLASGEWQRAFATSLFEELREVHLPNEVPLDRERVVALFLSMSNMARLPDEERNAFAERLRALVTDEPRRLLLRLDLFWTRLAAARPRPPTHFRRRGVTPA
jgi:ubiquinone/menaquinone biosynthesis C-methylase UbiE